MGLFHSRASYTVAASFCDPFETHPALIALLGLAVILGFTGSIMGTVAVIQQRRQVYTVGKVGRHRWVPITGMLVAGITASLKSLGPTHLSTKVDDVYVRINFSSADRTQLIETAISLKEWRSPAENLPVGERLINAVRRIPVAWRNAVEFGEFLGWMFMLIDLIGPMGPEGASLDCK